MPEDRKSQLSEPAKVFLEATFCLLFAALAIIAIAWLAKAVL